VARLAVIVPAWKPDFLAGVLESFRAQTCQDFHLYIGDDGSPYDLEPVARPYLASGNISYHRFENNLGGKDLVGQWERCIALTQEEPWIWMFSDDDLCSPECVEALLGEVDRQPDADLFHFPIQTIDAQGNPKGDRQAISLTSATDYFERRILDGYQSFVVEYVFSRRAYLREGGFERFDLAWGSDDATWIKFARQRPPTLVLGTTVFWRASALNISPRITADVATRKIEARLAFHAWLRQIPELWTGRLSDARHTSRWFHEHVRHMAVSVEHWQILQWTLRFRRASGASWLNCLGWNLLVHLSKLKATATHRHSRIAISHPAP